MSAGAFDPMAWNDAPVNDEGGNQDPPGLGDWTVVLRDARAFTSKAGADFVAFTLEVATGDEAGFQWDLLFSFKSAGAFKVTKSACARIGVDVESVASLQELHDRLGERVGEWLDVAVVASKNPEFPRPSTFINGVAQSQADALGFTPRSDVPVDADGFVPREPAAAGVQSGPHTDPNDGVPF